MRTDAQLSVDFLSAIIAEVPLALNCIADRSQHACLRPYNSDRTLGGKRKLDRYTMNALRCLRAVALPATFRPSTAQQYAFQHYTCTSIHTDSSRARNMSLLNARRPMVARMSAPSTLSAPGSAPSAVASPSETLDLMGKISAHPGFAGIQIRCGPRDTYNPSHIVRKRRHGFLSRLRTKKGRKLLMRRLTRGRWNLSH